MRFEVDVLEGYRSQFACWCNGSEGAVGREQLSEGEVFSRRERAEGEGAHRVDNISAGRDYAYPKPQARLMRFESTCKQCARVDVVTGTIDTSADVLECWPRGAVFGMTTRAVPIVEAWGLFNDDDEWLPTLSQVSDIWHDFGALVFRSERFSCH